jgi:hypothetical protein
MGRWGGRYAFVGETDIFSDAEEADEGNVALLAALETVVAGQPLSPDLAGIVAPPRQERD